MIRNKKRRNMQDGENHYNTSSSIDYAHDDIDDGMDEESEALLFLVFYTRFKFQLQDGSSPKK